MTALIAEFSFLAWPVINPVVSFIIAKILFIVFDKTVLAINYELIDFTKAKEAKEFLDAVKKLHTLLSENASQDQLKEANENFNSTFANAIHLKRVH